ncbi:Short-chain dehydrogenase/reductase SDR OS=Tsukamurella paurometabola (strain ATCC 8368 / DSM/ CCUG 35730 / CIP 100753 / JCM 10117 / KCTC 9821 / NBRC 16120/ NCIMB 702349 / NCTC 13040) OX=521096 GN=Tpau_3825 PE=3 SV=1 [Tsukamurella paurometabola]|uniref:Short-chain dehydrogenase/reductase SDR n=1 Tax=Tsukamurella paurometabola (strain ATCC 8368 / DSM 20162 / CCUG 35730 / CIP 100753 / JCM 10117 / KCTC 9821 / NBRC 16120 / NCIMB 702349 / NCTC 13040) TaxID=521096 RepID=D5UYU7_TSUPD|nr:SDR family oxidoreductase [Tsukamurella paurometabola]ADG80400.1 short-chain dehydrogenase/reductase SDR [Tsukamurella paurometabola DSM 20162]SUP39491.1 Glucose 1-dehydrogenase [Tsukamurella paurometabola]
MTTTTPTLGLDGLVVLVTGGVRGIGAGIARVFLRAGATVVVCARHSPESAISIEGRSAGFVACDVREPEQVDALIGGIVERHGRLDVLVNNAGGAPYSDAATASPRFHDKVIGLNLLAPLLVAQRANAVMQQAGRGSIINVSSVSATRPSPGTAAYGAAKAGLDSLTASLAVEWAPAVRVNALDVGMVRTEAAEQHYGDEAGIAAIGATVPLGRLADPEEIGSCAAFLASPLASYVSGATLLVHGGGERPAFLAAATADRA